MYTNRLTYRHAYQQIDKQTYIQHTYIQIDIPKTYIPTDRLTYNIHKDRLTDITSTYIHTDRHTTYTNGTTYT